MPAFVGKLCTMHKEWAVDLTQFDELPRGWQGLVLDLFDAIGTVMAERPGERLGILQVKEKWGGLRFYLRPMETGPDDGARPRYPEAVGALIADAERRSLLTCDVCGQPGSLRCDVGAYATRCDEHADAGLTGHPDPEATELGEAVHRPSEALGGALKPATSRTPDPNVRRSLRKKKDVSALEAVRQENGIGDGTHRVALYTLEDVAAAAGRRLGRARHGGDGGEDASDGEPEERRAEPDTEHQARLIEILDDGEAGRWRELAGVPDGAFDALDDLGQRAPHMGEMTSLVRRHLQAARTIGLPLSLPPVFLVGPPGVGKTWFMARLATIFGVPFRHYPMNAATLSEGLSGAYPNWRNAQPGLVSKTLLRERVANPLILVDEIDKAKAHGLNGDPYAAFYTFLEPAGASNHVDEYLQFPMNASGVIWMLAGNDPSKLPGAILDRLTILTVPDMGPDQAAAVARSIYAEANAARRGFFDPEPGEAVLERLARLNPRSIRIAIEDGMVTAAAAGRPSVLPDDLRLRERRPPRRSNLH